VAPIKPIVIAHTEGNPFFLEECVRTLAETDALVGQRGNFRLGTPLPELDVPATVQAILAARIDRLSAPDKRLLQAAAVIGRVVPLPLLLAVADGGEAEVLGGLARFQGRELLQESQLFPDPEYTFTHALTQDVASRMLLKDRRRELHARTLDAIERVYGEPVGDQLERLVHHAVQGEAWEKAGVYATRAGTRATDLSATVLARTHYETALEALAHLPERPETMAQAIEVRRLLAGAYFALAERERYLEVMEEALELAQRLGEPRLLANVLNTRTNSFWFAGEIARARDAGERAVALAEARETTASGFTRF
jgi:predicted ATPase